MFCPKCGTSNPDNAEVCMSCQHHLASPVSDTSLAAGEVIYAGFWERFAAMFVDSILVSVVLTPVVWVVMFLVALVGSNRPDSPAFLVLIALSFFLVFFLAATYYAVMESGERGATFGKRWLKLRVVDSQGERISKVRGYGRYVAHLVSYLTFYIGFLIQPFTARKQALHDMASGTLVVKTDREVNKIAIIIAILFTLLSFVFTIGFVAAVSIPAYQGYVSKAKVIKAVSIGEQANKAVEDFYNKNGRIPANLDETHAPINVPSFIASVGIDQDNGDVEVVFQSQGLPGEIAGKSIVFHPSRDEQGNIAWQCSSDSLRATLLPERCQ